MGWFIVATAVLPDSRVQVWEVQTTGHFRTRWKLTADPNSQWTGWSDFNVTGITTGVQLQDVTAGSLSDGRPQLWAIDDTWHIYTSWKLTTDPKSLWNNWIPFPTPGIPSGTQFFSVSAVPLPDKRLQLFIMDGSNVIWTSWKTTTDSKSAWTNFSQFV